MKKLIFILVLLLMVGFVYAQQPFSEEQYQVELEKGYDEAASYLVGYLDDATAQVKAQELLFKEDFTPDSAKFNDLAKVYLYIKLDFDKKDWQIAEKYLVKKYLTDKKIVGENAEIAKKYLTTKYIANKNIMSKSGNDLYIASGYLFSKYVDKEKPTEIKDSDDFNITKQYLLSFEKTLSDEHEKLSFVYLSTVLKSKNKFEKEDVKIAQAYLTTKYVEFDEKIQDNDLTIINNYLIAKKEIKKDSKDILIAGKYYKAISGLEIIEFKGDFSVDENGNIIAKDTIVTEEKLENIKKNKRIKGIEITEEGQLRFILVEEEMPFDFTKGKIEIDEQGNIVLTDAGFKRGDTDFYGTMTLRPDGKLDIEEGTINGKKIVDGTDIEIDLEGNIKGKATTIAGATLWKSALFKYDSKNNILAPHADVVDIAEDITIQTHKERFIIKHIHLPNENYLYDGQVTYSCKSKCEPSKVGKDSHAKIEGIEHATKSLELNINKKIGNYFIYGDDYFELGGKDFTSVLTEGNKYLKMEPENEDQGLVKSFGMTRRIKLTPKGPKGGEIRFSLVSEPGKPPSAYVKAQGDVEIINGNWEMFSEEDKLYSRPGGPNLELGSMLVATDMRIEYLDRRKVTKTYDLNVGTSYLRKLTDQGIKLRRIEFNEMRETRKILEERKKLNLQEDKGTDWDKVFRYLDRQIDKKELEINNGVEEVLPVFGEAIGLRNKVKVSSSSWFKSKIINTKDAQTYKGAAFIIAQRPGSHDPAFDVAAQTSAIAEANKGYYVLYMEDVIKEYPNFFNILKDPNLEAVTKDLKINKVELYSHSWPGGAWFDMHEGEYMPGFLEEEFEDKGKANYYYKYLSKEKIRTVDWEHLNQEQIDLMRKRLSKDAIISYMGCNVGDFPSMASKTHDILKVKVQASPVGSYVQKWDTENKVWTAYRLDENGNPIYAKDKQGKIIYEGGIKKRKGEVYRKGDIARMNPNLGLLSREYIQEKYPGITGYLTITGSKEKKDERYYQVEYPTDKETKNVWLSDFGEPVTELVIGEEPITDEDLLGFRPKEISGRQLKTISEDDLHFATYGLEDHLEDLQAARDEDRITSKQFEAEKQWTKSIKKTYENEDILRRIKKRPSVKTDLSGLSREDIQDSYFELTSYRHSLTRARDNGQITQNEYETRYQWANQHYQRYNAQFAFVNIQTRPGIESGDLSTLTERAVNHGYGGLRNYILYLGVAHDAGLIDDTTFNQRTEWAQPQLQRYEAEYIRRDILEEGYIDT